MDRMPHTYAAVLNSLVEMYNMYKRPIKSCEISRRLNISDGTIRNIMVALRAMGFVSSKTGPNGGYVPTQRAYEFVRFPQQLSMVFDVVPIAVNGVLVGVYAASVEMIELFSPHGSRAIVRIIGDIKSLNVGDKIRIGPTVTSRIIIEGEVIDKNTSSNEITLRVNRMLSIPKIKVGDIMSKNVITISKDASLRAAAELFAKYRIRALPVVDNGRIVGIFTTRELAKLVSECKVDVKVGDHMRREVPIINAESDIFDAMKLMTKYGIGRLIVVDSSGSPVGIVTRTDILRCLAALD